MKLKYKIMLFANLIALPMASVALTHIAPARAALVDTGYDACMQSGGQDCANNKNLLFRGNIPLDDSYRFEGKIFRDQINNYLGKFRDAYTTNADMPTSIDELNNYRIVMIDLVYDGTQHGNEFEYALLTNEFKYAGANATSTMPQQHKLYHLQSAFNPNEVAFEWWPITMLGKDNQHGIAGAINWPVNEIIPVPKSDQTYLSMDIPYLVTGTVYPGDTEKNDAVDIRTLLLSQPTDGHPLLIFYHCYAGMDRTGAVTLAYLMSHGGYANVSESNHIKKLTRNAPLNYSAALAATTQEKYPTPDEEALMTAQAFCEYTGRSASDCDV